MELIELDVPLSIQEGYHILEQTSWGKFKESDQFKERYLKSCLTTAHISCYMAPSQIDSLFITVRRVNSLYFRMKLNAFLTKFCKHVRCPCGDHISNTHIIFECPIVKPFLPKFCEQSLGNVFENSKLAFAIARCLLHSPLEYLL